MLTAGQRKNIQEEKLKILQKGQTALTIALTTILKKTVNI